MNHSNLRSFQSPSPQAMDMKNVRTDESLSTSFIPPGTVLPPDETAVLAARKSLQRRFSVNQLTTLPWGLEQDLEHYQRNGIAAIGLEWRKLREYGARRSIRRILESGMKISSLSCIGGFTGENGQSTQETMAECRKLIRIAGQLRAGTVTVVTGPQGGHIRSNANRLVVDALKQLVPMAALYGVQLALQPMHPMFARSWTFLHSLDDTLKILDRVGDSRLKIAFHSYHLWQEPNLTTRISEMASQIGLVRLADWGETPRHDHDRLMPGQGRLPLAGLVQALDASGYSGWYELEVWSRDLWKLDQPDLMQACLTARDQLAASLVAC